ncbi:cutinase family protein [Rhodococcus sp. JVH1]|uniref:cutinase family protein n=1 Tax=Rhodococcus sp. JVH1 TaxID=745408 RepID=UPI0002720CF8|nr:cutinase family protein [Rhodococcus sp. JVH1]EJJ01419.1 cutinase family protein [Rhodococcus sp. JVH1]
MIASGIECTVYLMATRTLARFLCTAVLTFAALLGVPVESPPASAQPCPDVEVAFARGTDQPDGVGITGVSFVESLRLFAGARSIGVYAVNYPAASNFDDRQAFLHTFVDGMRDMHSRIQFMATSCPNTRMVVGGYSQGAAVAGFVTADGNPAGLPTELGLPGPLSPDVASHVAAVVFFGKPSDRFMHDAGSPPIVVGPLFGPKTIDLCAPGDNICDGAPLGRPNVAHALYPANGMTIAAAQFAAARL